MPPICIIFDIGGVLVDWQPHLAWGDTLGSRAACDAFMVRTDFMARNARADAGETFADLAGEIDDPADAALFAEYVSRFPVAVPNAMAGTWKILDRLIARQTPVHAITNWSAETWPEGLKAHPRLGEVFDTLVVSGREGVMKPEARIFEIFCERAGVEPHNCVFIDDGLHNVQGARSFGMDGIHFENSLVLETALKGRGLL